MTTLADELGRSPGFDAVVEALTVGLSEAIGAPLVPAGLSPDESALVDSLVAGKYGTEAWTVEGRLPEGVRAAGAPAGAIS
jgi:lipoate-protein ligase A